MTIADEIQSELDAIFGVGEHKQPLRRFATLRDLYAFYTGDREMTGVFSSGSLPSELRMTQDINSTSFPIALANTLNRFLSAGYNQVNFFDQILISQRKPAAYLHEGEFVQLGFWGDLPQIDPEAADYYDMPKIEEHGESFNLLQKGCAIPISRKVILNDDIGLLKAYMMRLGHVAKKTHARYVWNMYLDNNNSNDGTPWFSSDHGNLGTQALSISAVTAGITALAEMIELGPSSDKVGLDLSSFKWHLIVPVAKWDEAVKINQTRDYYSANDLTSKTINPCFGLFGASNERIATPPFLPDSTQWGIIRNPEEIPIIEMEYLEGREEPESYFEQSPQSDMAMRRDFFGLKCRHEYGGKVSDHRGAYKSTP